MPVTMEENAVELWKRMPVTMEENAGNYGRECR